MKLHFYSERVVDQWNSLDQQVIDSATLTAFKSGFDRTRRTLIGFFTDLLSLTVRLAVGHTN